MHAFPWIAVAAFVVHLAAGSQSPQRPVFRGGISLVPVDVRVVDRNGRPITDLRQEDFTILEDGRPQTLRHFSMHQFTPDPAAAAKKPDIRTAPTEELAPANSRTFLIVMGRGRHQSVSKYVDALAKFVSDQIHPQDHVALLAWNRATDFTTDHALITQVVTRYRDRHERIEVMLREWFSGLRAIYGSKTIPEHIQREIDGVFANADAIRPRPMSPAPVADAGRIEQTIQRTAQDLQRSQEIEARLKAGIKTLTDLSAAITGGLIDQDFEEYIAQMAETMHDVGNLYAGIGYLRFLAGEKHLVFVTEQGVHLPSQDNNASLARVASDARIALDFVQTGGVTIGPGVRIVEGRINMPSAPSSTDVFRQTFAIQDLRLMAERTGGQMMAFKTGEESFRRLHMGLQSQYLLGYTPSNVVLDGKFRKVTVRVNRPGAVVLVREGYLAVETPVALDRREMITFGRIRAAAEYHSVVDHIKVTLGRPVGSATEVSIDVTVDISKVRFTSRDGRQEAELDVAVFAGDEKDQPVGELKRRADIRQTPEEHERARQKGVTLKLTVPLRAAAQVVKVVVYDYNADLVGSALAKVSR